MYKIYSCTITVIPIVRRIAYGFVFCHPELNSTTKHLLHFAHHWYIGKWDDL